MTDLASIDLLRHETAHVVAAILGGAISARITDNGAYLETTAEFPADNEASANAQLDMIAAGQLYLEGVECDHDAEILAVMHPDDLAARLARLRETVKPIVDAMTDSEFQSMAERLAKYGALIIARDKLH